MTLPKTILDIIKVIHDKLEIAPEKDKIIAISLWNFKDENGNTIPKMDLKNGLRKLAEDEKLFQLRNVWCLDKLGRTSGEKIELEINRERFKKFYKKHLREQKTPIGKVEFLHSKILVFRGFPASGVVSRPSQQAATTFGSQNPAPPCRRPEAGQCLSALRQPASPRADL